MAIIGFEQIVFMQGDDYDEFERVLYPDSDAVSIGFSREPDKGVAYLAQWNYGEPTERQIENPYDTSCGAGVSHYETDAHVMMWHYGLRWAALYRVVHDE